MAFVARYEVGRTSVLGKSITGLGDREREIEMFSSWEKQNFTFINASKSIRKLETYSKGWYYESMDWMPPSTKGCVGLRIGAKGRFDDYRSAAVYGKGLEVGLNG